MHEIVFSSLSTFRRKVQLLVFKFKLCSLSPSLSLSHTHSPRWILLDPFCWNLLAPFSFCTAFTFHPMSKCSWPFTPDLSPHFLVILLTLSFRRCATYFYIKFITFRLIFSRVLYTV